MKITIVCLGKTKQNFIETGLQEYAKRLSKYAQINFLILPDVQLTKTNSCEIVKQKEASILLKNWKEKDFVIALDENGRQFSSPEFASLLCDLQPKTSISFLIGGVYGLAEEILKKADLILSFSRFTFTHQMIRLLLLEQIYRAFTICEGKKYHY